MHRIRALSFITALLLPMVTSGCDPLWRLHTTVVVPPETQQDVSSYPAEVYIYTEKQAAEEASNVNPKHPGPYRIGVLDEPGEARSFRRNLEGVGCAIKTEVIAWIQPASTKEDTLEGRSTTGISRLIENHVHARKVAFPEHIEPVCAPSSYDLKLTLTENGR